MAIATAVTLGTATPGGGFPVYGDAVAATVNATDPSLDVKTRNTKGRTENVPRLEAGTLDLGLMGHGEVAGRDWLLLFRGYVHDLVEAVRAEVATGATLDETKPRVIAKLAPVYEKPFSAYGDYRPWRTQILGNIERTFALVS